MRIKNKKVKHLNICFNFIQLLIIGIILDPALSQEVLCNQQSICGPSVCALVGDPSLNILGTVHNFFLIFCMKLGHHKGTKVTEPNF